jgi:hypothetical protein
VIADIPGLDTPVGGGLVTLVIGCAGWLLNRYRKAVLAGEDLGDRRVAAANHDAELRVEAYQQDFEVWKARYESDRLKVQMQLVECEARCKEQDLTIFALNSTIGTLSAEMAEVKRELAVLRDVS